MKKPLKYLLITAIIGLLGYNSVFLETLSSRKQKASVALNFETLADSLYYRGILPKSPGVAWSVLQDSIAANPEAAFSQYGNRLGIGNSAYFMIQASGTIESITETSIALISDDSSTLRLETRYIFGNAIRDASRLVALTDFKTTSEFNSLSEALNRLIRNKVIPEAITGLQPGDQISVTGAVKLNRSESVPQNISVFPATLKKIP
ncbi:MAG: hypothetical protein RLZZ241_891 [Bacteroidota bacterium]